MKTSRLVAVGDISFGDHYASASIGVFSHLRQKGQADPFRDARLKIRSGELAFANLETVLSASGLDIRNLHSMHMRGEPAAVRVLKNAGFNVVNVANNHMLQHGARAFTETIDLLRSEEIGIVGLASRNGWNCVPYKTRMGTQEVVFLGYGFEKDKYFKGTTLYAQGAEDAVLEDIRASKTESNVVVCSFHWGNEFVAYSSMEQVRLARRAIDAGCSLIIGHHPHVLNGYEYWNGGLILYSLGNFLFDQFWNPLCREGCLLQLSLREQKFRIERMWITQVGTDFKVRVNESEAYAERRFGELNGLLERALASGGACYRTDRELAERRNRYQSWAYLAKNFYRYDRTILTQIISDTMKRKFRRGRVAAE